MPVWNTQQLADEIKQLPTVYDVEIRPAADATHTEALCVIPTNDGDPLRVNGFFVGGDTAPPSPCELHMVELTDGLLYPEGGLSSESEDTEETYFAIRKLLCSKGFEVV